MAYGKFVTHKNGSSSDCWQFHYAKVLLGGSCTVKATPVSDIADLALFIWEVNPSTGTIVQQTAVDAGAVTALLGTTLAFVSNVTTGNYLIVGTLYYSNTSAIDIVCTDSQSNTSIGISADGNTQGVTDVASGASSGSVNYTTLTANAIVFAAFTNTGGFNTVTDPGGPFTSQDLVSLSGSMAVNPNAGATGNKSAAWSWDTSTGFSMGMNALQASGAAPSTPAPTGGFINPLW